MRPSVVTCVMVDVSITTCVCITFGPVLLKVNRIWGIFNATNGKRPRYTGPKQQIHCSNCSITNRIAGKTLPFEVVMFIPYHDVTYMAKQHIYSINLKSFSSEKKIETAI